MKSCHAIQSSPPPSATACWLCRYPRRIHPALHVQRARPVADPPAVRLRQPLGCSCAYCASPVRACYPMLRCRCHCCNGSDSNCGSTRHVGHSMPSRRKPGTLARTAGVPEHGAVRLRALTSGRKRHDRVGLAASWLRQSPAKPNSRHMLEHIEHLKAWQALDLHSPLRMATVTGKAINAKVACTGASARR